MKASDITDQAMLRAVHEQCVAHDSWCCWPWLADENFAEFPRKVVLAKVRQLLKRRLVHGCGCGCRGDLELEPIGCEMIGVRPHREPWWNNPNYGAADPSDACAEISPAELCPHEG